MSNEQKTEKLVSEAKHSNDPTELRKIAKHLEELGAWGEAQAVRTKINHIEKKLAEVN